MDRYEKLREIRRRLLNLSSELGLSKGDFEASEYDLVEQAQDKVDEAVAALLTATGGR